MYGMSLESRFLVWLGDKKRHWVTGIGSGCMKK